MPAPSAEFLDRLRQRIRQFLSNNANLEPLLTPAQIPSVYVEQLIDSFIKRTGELSSDNQESLARTIFLLENEAADAKWSAINPVITALQDEMGVPREGAFNQNGILPFLEVQFDPDKAYDAMIAFLTEARGLSTAQVQALRGQKRKSIDAWVAYATDPENQAAEIGPLDFFSKVLAPSFNPRTTAFDAIPTLNLPSQARLEQRARGELLRRLNEAGLLAEVRREEGQAWLNRQVKRLVQNAEDAAMLQSETGDVTEEEVLAFIGSLATNTVDSVAGLGAEGFRRQLAQEAAERRMGEFEAFLAQMPGLSPEQRRLLERNKETFEAAWMQHRIQTGDTASLSEWLQADTGREFFDRQLEQLQMPDLTKPEVQASEFVRRAIASGRLGSMASEDVTAVTNQILQRLQQRLAFNQLSPEPQDAAALIEQAVSEIPPEEELQRLIAERFGPTPPGADIEAVVARGQAEVSQRFGAPEAIGTFEQAPEQERALAQNVQVQQLLRDNPSLAIAFATGDAAKLQEAIEAANLPELMRTADVGEAEFDPTQHPDLSRALMEAQAKQFPTSPFDVGQTPSGQRRLVATSSRFLMELEEKMRKQREALAQQELRAGQPKARRRTGIGAIILPKLP